jgi:site-specific recombinase
VLAFEKSDGVYIAYMSKLFSKMALRRSALFLRRMTIVVLIKNKTESKMQQGENRNGTYIRVLEYRKRRHAAFAGLSYF